MLVGSNTVMYDNPTLNVRDWSGRNPLRIVLDRYLKCDSGNNIFSGDQHSLHYNTLLDKSTGNSQSIRVSEQHFLQDVITDLHQRKVQSLIVEGGAATLALFINANLWDEARIFTSSEKFNAGIPAPRVQGTLVSEQRVIDNILRMVQREALPHVKAYQ